MEVWNDFYMDTESADNYYRDRCVFADEIDIYDTISVNVKYSKGSLLKLFSYGTFSV